MLNELRSALLTITAPKHRTRTPRYRYRQSPDSASLAGEGWSERGTTLQGDNLPPVSPAGVPGWLQDKQIDRQGDIPEALELDCLLSRIKLRGRVSKRVERRNRIIRHYAKQLCRYSASTIADALAD